MKKTAFFLALVFALLSTTIVLAAVVLNLPAEPVTITHGLWFGNAPDSPIAITLSDVPVGYDVTNGDYNGWCIEDNGQDNAPQVFGTLTQPAGERWNKINWVLNNWKTYSTNYYDAQVAIWMLTGTNQSFVTPEAQAIYDAANSNGVSFEPGPGDKVAVIAFSDTTVADQYQDTIIEVTIPHDGPGTGTPGYWKNHPEAWPVDSITIGNYTYTKDQAIALMTQGEAQVGKGADKSLTLFRAYVAAFLNGEVGNNTSCIDGTLADAYAWLVKYGVGTQVLGKSDAWKLGEPLYWTLDNYNNGYLCAPSRG